MLRTDSVSSIPRVGAATRSSRSRASNGKRPRVGRGEAIEMQERRFGYFPQRFEWRGDSHIVQSVERCWTRTSPSPQLCFRVRCSQGIFDLTQHVKNNRWTLAAVQGNP
jgi:hypothetical protein